MKLTDEIKKRLISWVNRSNDIVVPNYYHGLWEMDVLKIMSSSDYLIEYEIKVSRADYFADFRKPGKHSVIQRGERCNRFWFVVPKGLIQVNEVPSYAGLIEYNGSFCQIKNAPLLHRRPFSDWKTLSTKLVFINTNLRAK